MRSCHALGLLAATPIPLLSLTAQAYDPAETFRASDPIAEATIEDARALEGGRLGSADPIPTSSPRSWVSLAGFWRRNAFGRSDLGMMLTLALPLDRVAARPGAPRSGHATGVAETQPEPSQPPAVPPAVVVPMRVSSKLARSCVQAAWRAQGWQTDDDLERMVARMRWGSLLPEVRVRVARGWDESFRLTPTDSDPYRTQEATGTSGWLEGRLTWRLDRAVFADEELQVERARAQRAEARTRLTGRVLTVLFEWQRAVVAAADPTLATQEHVSAVVARLEAEATLDVLTAGWFGSWLERSGK